LKSECKDTRFFSFGKRFERFFIRSRANLKQWMRRGR